MREIILIRHGKTYGNTLGRYIGITDEELCLEGREELAALRESGQYRSIRPDLVYVSPLRRCRQTAELLFPGVPQEICRDFRECDFGEFENKNYKELSGNPAYQAWVDSGGTPGIESAQETGREQCSLCGARRDDYEHPVRVCRAGREAAGTDAARTGIFQAGSAGRGRSFLPLAGEERGRLARPVGRDRQRRNLAL